MTGVPGYATLARGAFVAMTTLFAVACAGGSGVFAVDTTAAHPPIALATGR